MDIIVWNKEYILGIELIDDQHKMLINILNKLIEDNNASRHRNVLKDTISALAEYIDYHFSIEEDYFEKFKYPAREEHIDEHKVFIAKIKSFSAKLRTKELTATEIINYLKNWLVNHILKTDKAYIPFFKENGVK